jgi:hypothetical protein
MITASARKKLGTARFEPIRDAKYLSWEDAFEIEFESGLTYLVSNRELRAANRLPRRSSTVAAVWVDPELRSGFHVRYEDGQVAEASWEFVKEEVGPPQGVKGAAMVREGRASYLSHSRGNRKRATGRP